MPATEQTWRNQLRLHFVFGATGLLLLLSTLWMFAADHDRSWKKYQRNARNIDITLSDWRKYQYQTDKYRTELARLQADLREARGRGFAKNVVERFKNEVRSAEQELEGRPAPTFDKLDRQLQQLNELAQRADRARGELLEAQVGVDRLKVRLEEAQAKQAEAQQASEKATEAVAAASEDQKAAAQQAATEARTAAEEAADEVDSFERQLEEAREALRVARTNRRSAESAVSPRRQAVLETFDDYIERARFEETTLLQERKFTSANLDKAKADLDLAIDDERPTEEVQVVVDDLAQQLQKVTLRWQARSDHRKDLEKIRDELTKDEANAEKKLNEHVAEQERLEKSIQERQSKFFVGVFPGKKWLELPILDAFNSPLKIENLWSDELEWNINFRTTRRFDRCTTCHQNVLKTLPGSTEPAYAHQELYLLTLAVEREEGVQPETEASSAAGSGSVSTREPTSVAQHYGLRMASDGLLSPFDVTVTFVEPYSLAAQASPFNSAQLELLPTDQIRLLSLQPVPIGAHENISPGLLVGDVIESVNGDRVRSAEQAEFALLEAARSGEPVQVQIRRGLPHPYATHPRLDLYLGSASPHKLQDFACSICHEGQGSATEFKWASHTPNDPIQRSEWGEDHGWFDNHHWIYPMYAKRFQQSACLKCHHDVTELEVSDRFPEPPAPKLMHGHQLILKYGCFGCHEVNGFDGPKRIGPDLRLEPNFFAAAQRLLFDPSYAALNDQEKDWVQQLIEYPERDGVRRKLYEALISDSTSPEPRLTDDARNVVAPMLKDIESPGKLRKVGPSLRFVKSKLDVEFLYDWIRNPKHFRPSTRMPQFFGLYNHLEGKGRQVAEEYEPIEILGLVRYLEDRSQPFSYLQPPEGITSSAVDERIERGKIAFEQQGCLACHSHRDFPDLDLYRPSDKIQQAPDLSNLGDKFDPERNPQGREWLYSWIKQPNKYHVRTLMPNLFLEPVVERDAQGNVTALTDPVADIVEYLMSSRSDWQPAAGTLVELDEEGRTSLDKLTTEYLNDAFFVRTAQDYLKNGIPESVGPELKGAEKELLVPDDEYRANQQDENKRIPDELKLLYIGKKTVAKFGCYGCHDIPEFEDSKPIGTGLADWGRKDPARLAFEHIGEYIGHAQHGEPAGHGVVVTPEALAPPSELRDTTLEADRPESDDGTSEESDADSSEGQPADSAQAEQQAVEDPPPFYLQQLDAGNRIGFIYQKLREPRSYDFRKTENKKYNDRLRMPEFAFSVEEREAVITFVLGLVGDPPKLKYVFRPNARTKALLEGRQVLEKFNCGGCHVLDGERWEISYQPGQYGEQQRSTTYPFLLPQPSLAETERATTIDYRSLRHAVIEGLPPLDNDGLPLVNDLEGEPVFEGESYSVKNVEFSLYLFKPAVLDGFPYQVNERGLGIRGSQIERRYPANGGDLAKYLLPRVVAREQAKIPTLKGSEAWGWLPPPLINEGEKVQTDWLHSFLLEPYPIRPSVVLRMPKFNMTPQEATTLVNYFAARDNAQYPYSYSSRQRSDHLQQAELAHQALLTEEQISLEGTRLDHAVRVVTNPNYCVQCHIVGDFEPTKDERGKGPDLSQVYKRLRPDYLRNWIAQPTVYLPYTGMPVNIKYDPELPFTGSLVPQELFPGDSTDQLDGLVDLLMNYDTYSADRNRITPLVQEQQHLLQEQPADDGTTPPETIEETTTEEAATEAESDEATGVNEPADSESDAAQDAQ